MCLSRGIAWFCPVDRRLAIGVTGMTREIEFRLVGHLSHDGQLLAADALSLIRSFKDLTYRLTRAVAERPGLGRTDAVLEKLATVRVALRDGSTRVVFVVGDEGALDLDDPISGDVDRAFWDIIEGMDTGRRPEMVSDAVAESVDDLVVALSKAAPEAEVKVPGHGVRSVVTCRLSRVPWQRSAPRAAGETQLHGILEMVDLRTSRFRLRDVAGNAVDLLDVVDPESAAHLVGERVSARGVLAVGHGTQHHRIERPVLTAQEPVVSRFDLSPAASISELTTRARTVTDVPPMDLSLEELDTFLAEIRA